MRQKRTYIPALLMAGLLAAGAGVASAAGGKLAGGGGTATGGTATGGGGGGAIKATDAPKTCPSIFATYSATDGYRPGAYGIALSYALATCTPRNITTVRLTNQTTGAIEYNAQDPVITTFNFDQVSFGSTYLAEVVVNDRTTGALIDRRSSTVATPAVPAPNCATLADPVVTTALVLGAPVIAANYSATDCGYGRESVTVRMTNLTTNLVEYEAPYNALTGSVTMPKGKSYDTPYEVDVEVHGAVGEVVSGSSKTVTTPAFTPNCANITGENLSTGYWGLYAAVWVQYQVRDCGYGGERVQIRAYDMASGSLDYNVTTTTLAGLFDFEGTATKYDTDYEIHVDVLGLNNELLDSMSQLVHTPVFR